MPNSAASFQNDPLPDQPALYEQERDAQAKQHGEEERVREPSMPEWMAVRDRANEQRVEIRHDR